MEITYNLLTELVNMVSKINNTPKKSKLDVYEDMGSYFINLIIHQSTATKSKPDSLKIYRAVRNINASTLSAKDIKQKASFFDFDRDMIYLAQMLYTRLSLLVQENNPSDIDCAEFIRSHAAMINNFYRNDPYLKPQHLLNLDDLISTFTNNKDLLVYSVISVSDSFLVASNMIMSKAEAEKEEKSK